MKYRKINQTTRGNTFETEPRSNSHEPCEIVAIYCTLTRAMERLYFYGFKLTAPLNNRSDEFD